MGKENLDIRISFGLREKKEKKKDIPITYCIKFSAYSNDIYT